MTTTCPRPPLPPLLLLLGSLLGPATARADASPLAETGAQRAAVASPQDRSFLNLFLRAGLATAEAGRLAAQRSADPEVRQLGAALDAEAREANRELDSLAAPLDLPPFPAEPDAEHKATASRLQRAAPVDFDRQFLKQQVRDQDDLLQVLAIEADTGDNPLLRAFAARQTERLRESRRQAKALAAQLPALPPLELSGSRQPK